MLAWLLLSLRKASTWQQLQRQPRGLTQVSLQQ
jgi:hypothetical protein